MIYESSFKSMKYNEFGTLDTNEIGDIVIPSYEVKTIYNVFNIEFIFTYNETKELIMLTGNIKSKELEYSTTVSYGIDPQIFTDEMLRAVENRQMPQTYDCILSVSNKIIKEIENILLANGELLKEIEIETFGFLYSGNICNENRIGSFESIKIINERTIEIIDDCSIIELKNAEDLRIDFIHGKNKFSTTLKHSQENVFTFTKLNKTDKFINYNIIPKEEFGSIEELKQDRMGLLTKNILSDNNSIDEFSDLF